MAALTDTTVRKKTAKDFGTDVSFPALAPFTKILRYQQDRVHDFAWFANKRFNVLRDTVHLPSGRVVTSLVQFYLPVADSQFANGRPTSHQNFTDGIRFVLNLNQLSPFRLLDDNLGW